MTDADGCGGISHIQNVHTVVGVQVVGIDAAVYLGYLHLPIVIVGEVVAAIDTAGGQPNGVGRIGDINTHRIVAIEGNSYVTKGDNNLLRDNEGDHPYVVYYTDVIGVVDPEDRIGGLGGVIAFLHSSLGFFLCIVLPLALFFLYELYCFISVIVSTRAQKAPISAETEEEIKRRAIEEYLRQQAAAAEEKPKDATAENDADENK